MYGKIFGSMFEGSLCGAGPVVFSVMSYVISHQEPDETTGSQVRLVPCIMAAAIGKVTCEQVEEAIEFLCEPDPNTTTEGDDGRRLIKVGAFDYRVVNGKHYRDMMSKEALRAANREAKRRQREKEKAQAEESKAYGQMHGVSELRAMRKDGEKTTPPTSGEEG